MGLPQLSASRAPSVALRAARLTFPHQVLLVSALPWVLFLILRVQGQMPMVFVVLALGLGTPHVLATAALYLDPGLRDHVRAHRTRYLVAPAAVLVIATVAFAAAPTRAATFLLLGFLLWQTHHFTKQNLGMVAFSLRATKRPGLTTRERRLILGTTAIGALGVIRLMGLAPSVDGPLRAAGVAMLVVAAAVAVRPGDLRRSATLLGPVAFYSPLLLFSVDLGTAALAYQAAHGAQYYLMTAHAARPTPAARRDVLVLLLVGGPLIAAASLLGPYGGEAWVFGAAKGVVAAHFIADAGFWRLRDPEIRGFMQKRFVFLG